MGAPKATGQGQLRAISFVELFSTDFVKPKKKTQNPKRKSGGREDEVGTTTEEGINMYKKHDKRKL